jgi:hypothetical protein
MKKKVILLLMACITAAACILTGCSEPEEEQQILKEPPAVTVQCGEESVSALLGTYGWSYEEAPGQTTGINADSVAPSERIDSMTPLQLTENARTDEGSFFAEVKFAAAPDSVSIERYREQEGSFRQSEAEKIEDFTYTKETGVLALSLPEESCLYCIYAKWDSTLTYGGDASYSFYTVLQEE